MSESRNSLIQVITLDSVMFYEGTPEIKSEWQKYMKNELITEEGELNISMHSGWNRFLKQHGYERKVSLKSSFPLISEISKIKAPDNTNIEDMEEVKRIESVIRREKRVVRTEIITKEIIKTKTVYPWSDLIYRIRQLLRL